MFKKLKNGYEELWKAIIRPPRDEYSLNDLGPNLFSIENQTFQRTDMQITNNRNLKLECSFFEPIDRERACQHLPCVIYLHGNSSSRLEGIAHARKLLMSNIQLFWLDLAGSGKSGGDFISLGWYERDDLAVVVDYLRNSNRVSTIGLWGRSMGAATALMHGSRDPSIAGMVLDSPFADLRQLSDELAGNYAKVPKFILSTARKMIRKTIKTKANFDIHSLKPIDFVHDCFIPALFIYAEGDDFINPHHCKDLHDVYAGDKNIIAVEGDHNSVRSQFTDDSVTIFFYQVLQCDSIPAPEFSPGESAFPQFEVASRISAMPQMGSLEFGEEGDFDEDQLRKAIEASLAEN